MPLGVFPGIRVKQRLQEELQQPRRVFHVLEKYVPDLHCVVVGDLHTRQVGIHHSYTSFSPPPPPFIRQQLNCPYRFHVLQVK
jgi:hypothetical protein